MRNMRREPAGTPHGGRFAKGIGLSDEDIEAIQWEAYERENRRLAWEESGDDAMDGALGENTPEF